ncbi:HAD-like protein [Stemphylium lycopersici]|uniref:HAD-like protein n=1 Tax=Stemphylium lycopersici TaxID=183478 RepID=A0A364MWT0_STELY|nr:HAD-like protein [Stemphylium lycopersici]
MTHKQFRDATWFFFDLDDTLHEFRKASSAAVDAVLHLIIQQQQEQPQKEAQDQHQSLTIPSLKAAYTTILKTSTSTAFTDGKTSHTYRRSRFTTLLHHFSITPTEPQITQLLTTYEAVLTAHLAPKPSALALLATLQKLGKRVAIVTEGPQDSQERTVAALGLAPYFERLITTNALGVAKTAGLWERAMRELGVGKGEVVVVGDSWERDVVPAWEAGMRVVWFDEGAGDGVREVEVGEGGRKVFVISGLEKLRRIVLGEV